MTAPVRRGTLLAGVGLSAALTLGAARVATSRYGREFAERSAVTIAGYLSLVTPGPPNRSDYDLSLLLIRVRALETLPGWTPLVEVYHPTAPLVQATAPPLPPAELSRLRDAEVTSWQGGGESVVAPLFDRDEWDVVGAVGVRAPRLAPAWLEWWLWALGAVTLGLGVAAARAGGGAPLSRYAVASLLLALAAYADVRVAARRATDRWLTDTRILVQEAAAAPARPGLADLARAARGGELAVIDSGPADPARGRRDGVFVATLAVRLGPSRWVELRARAADGASAGWLLATLGLALLGPASVWLARWRGHSAPRAARETVAAWGFLAPALCHLAVFSMVPLLLVPYVALHAGTANLLRLTTDPHVRGSLGTTLLYALYVPVTMGLALVAALALPRRSWPGRLARWLLLVPYAASAVGTALLWERPLTWLAAPGTALAAVMLISLVAQLGYQMTVFQAGLASIPSEYADAARVEGAGGWRRFWKITLPLLRPVTSFALVTSLAGASQVFTYVFLLTQGGPLRATDTLAYRVYDAGWRELDLGYAGAIALGVALLLLPIMRAQWRAVGRVVEYA